MSEPVSLALIGCGGMMGAHARAYRVLWENDLREFRIRAVCDLDEGRARAMADAISEFQGETPSVYLDLEKLLDGEKSVEAVDISSLHRNHHELANACFEAGKHVCIEKPLAITMRACRSMRDASERAGKLLCVAENYRRDPKERCINWAVKSGRIGDIRMLYWLDVGESLGKWGWRDFKADAGGGWLLDGGVHFADLFRYHVGEAVSCIALAKSFEPYRYDRAETRENPIPVTAEDTALALLQFENGVLVEWNSSKAAPGRGFNARILYGGEGALDWSQGLIPRGNDPVDFKTLGAEFQASLSEEEKDRLFPNGVTLTEATELLEFVRAVRGRAKCEVDGVEGMKDEAICFAAYESAALGGQPVSIADIENCEIEVYQKELNEAAGLA